MKSLCTKGTLFLSLALLVVLVVACTQSKPAVPTPTLVPLASDTEAAPVGDATAVAPGDATAVAPPDATLVVPPTVDSSLATPDANAPTPDTSGGQPTAIIVEPTLLPTPTTVGDTSQPQVATPAGGDNSAQPTAVTAGACTNPYTVQAGDWFYLIARKCGVSAQALAAANPGMDTSTLRPGQTVNIPAGGTGGGAPPPPASGEPPAAPSGGTGGSTGSCSNPYVVQRGDTLYSIATRCGSTIAQIQAANGIPSPEYIFPGQQLQIP
jgi:peptidoglycan endopeptidase LytF